MINFAGSGSSPFGTFFIIILIIVLIATWVILATSRFTQGGIVERPERVPQLYGYTVCLIALAIAIVSVTGIVGSAFDLATPTMATDSEFGFEPSVSSFEAYRATYDRERRMMATGNSTVVADTTPESVLRQRYEALRNDAWNESSRDRIARWSPMSSHSCSQSCSLGFTGDGSANWTGRVSCRRRPNENRMTVKRMDNVGIVVESLDAAIAFFAELGLRLEGRATIEGEWAGRVTGLGSQRVEIAMMVTPDGHSRLELSRFLAPPVVADHRNAPVNALGYLRVMFTVDDIDDTLARLRKQRRAARRRSGSVRTVVPALLHPRPRRTSHRARRGAQAQCVDVGANASREADPD